MGPLKTSYANMQIQSISSPTSLKSLTYHYQHLSGDGEIWNQRTLPLIWVIWIKGIQWVLNTRLLSTLCFYLETQRIRLAAVLWWDRPSFCCGFWIPFPSASSEAGPNGSGSHSQLNYWRTQLCLAASAPLRLSSSWGGSVILIVFNEGCGNWPKFWICCTEQIGLPCSPLSASAFRSSWLVIMSKGLSLLQERHHPN